MLQIYRASAGSGKTYRLTLEYLKLLFKTPNAYLHILAVTFTNKATDEMKSRILQELDTLAHRVESSGYLDALMELTHLSQKGLQAEAHNILLTLLHDFSSFNISTIDRFFQQTMRAFTREIGIQGGYSLEVDSSSLLGPAIDAMLFELDKPENEQLLHWLMSYSQQRIDDAEGWNIRQDIEMLGGEIFKEKYKAHSDALLQKTTDKVFMRNYQKLLQEHVSVFKRRLKEIGEAGLIAMDREGLVCEDFIRGKSSAMRFFRKWAEGSVEEPSETFYKFQNEVENYSTKTAGPAIKARMLSVYHNGLNDAVCRAIELFTSEYALYLSVQQINRFFFALGILGDIDRYLRIYKQQHNKVLLSDTTELLSRLIDGSDTPFVYEKIGTRIDHYMIDEFQDTSVLQWDSFYPLIKESLDKDKSCLLVGDVKQSIYRWRNSDWKLLSHGVEQDFDGYGISTTVLDDNWRSGAYIIAFNNNFFETAATNLQSMINEKIDKAAKYITPNEMFRTIIKDAYSDVKQYLPDQHKEVLGHVRVQFVDELLLSDDDENWKEHVLNRLPEHLIQLQQKGYLLKDIAILVRNAREGALVANCLLQAKSNSDYAPYRFDLISNDSLLLGQMPIVRLIVSILAYINDPQRELHCLSVLFEYYTSHQSMLPSEAFARYFEQKNAHRTDVFDADVLSILQNIKHLPLFDMCESIVQSFAAHHTSEEGVYIQAFQDMVLDYTLSHAADISSFLMWWDERGSHKSISTPDTQDAIRILTIHKSKGLGFEAVIVPFMNWKIDVDATKNNILWCAPGVAPFDELPLVPIRYSSKLETTLFADSYYEEKVHAYIDNLNLAYVAFTRAKQQLIVFAPLGRSASNTVAQLLYEAVSQNNDLKTDFDAESNVYEIGAEWKPKPALPSELKELAMPYYSSIPLGERLRLRYRSTAQFVAKQRDYGTLMHEILSGVHLVSDIPLRINELHRAGEIERERADELIVRLTEWCAWSRVEPWFDVKATILNEQDLLFPSGEVLRPDRIVIYDDRIEVIDYKFGKIVLPEYHSQVQNYVDIVQQVFKMPTKGYLWYVELEQVVDVC